MVKEPGFTSSTETVPLSIDSLNEKLKPYFYDVSEPSLQECKANYLQNIQKSKGLQALIVDHPDSFDLIFNIVGDRIYTAEEIEILAQNIRIRQEEVVGNKEEVKKRIKNNPYATPDEYALGIYREQLETQVRDAVFEFFRKGYRPIGSGFYDLAQGTQAIILDENGVDMDLVKKILPDSVVVAQGNGEIKIIFRPKNGASIQDLKSIWDKIAYLIPPNSRLEKGGSGNGQQGLDLRKAQDEMKQGGDVWLGHGLAFVNGKVVEMSSGDFKRHKNRN